MSDGEWWANRDIETLRLLRDELQRTHAEALQTFTDLSQAAGRLLGIIGTTLTVIVAAAALVEDISNYLSPMIGVGVALIILSGVATILSHQTRNVTVGAGREEFQRALAVEPKDDNPNAYTETSENPLEEYHYLVWMTRNYVRWIDDLLSENKKKARRLRAGEYLYVGGLSFVFVGTLLAI